MKTAIHKIPLLLPPSTTPLPSFLAKGKISPKEKGKLSPLGTNNLLNNSCFSTVPIQYKVVQIYYGCENRKEHQVSISLYVPVGPHFPEFKKLVMTALGMNPLRRFPIFKTKLHDLCLIDNRTYEEALKKEEITEIKVDFSIPSISSTVIFQCVCELITMENKNLLSSLEHKAWEDWKEKEEYSKRIKFLEEENEKLKQDQIKVKTENRVREEEEYDLKRKKSKVAEKESCPANNNNTIPILPSLLHIVNTPNIAQLPRGWEKIQKYYPDLLFCSPALVDLHYYTVYKHKPMFVHSKPNEPAIRLFEIKEVELPNITTTLIPNFGLFALFNMDRKKYEGRLFPGGQIIPLLEPRNKIKSSSCSTLFKITSKTLIQTGQELNYYLDTSRYCNETRFIQDCHLYGKEPNVSLGVHYTVRGELQLKYVLLRDIVKGEPLLMDYSKVC